MKMIQAPEIEPKYNYTLLRLYIDNKNRQEIIDKVQNLTYDPATEYAIEIKKKGKKRTRSQRAYAWTLMGKLAEKLNLTPIEVYRIFMQNMYTYTLLQCDEMAVDRFIEHWESNGDGWIAIDLGACINEPFKHDVRAYTGISTFDRKTMHDFLEMVVTECKQQGIETLTPDEIAQMENITKVGDNSER